MWYSDHRHVIAGLRARLLHAHAENEIQIEEAFLQDTEVHLENWLIEIDRILGELLDSKRKYHLFQRRFSEILEFACQLANLEFDNRLELHGEYDEIDAVCMALNMLGEELQSSTLSRDQVQASFNAIPDFIIVIDAQGMIELANTAAGNLFGVHPTLLTQRAAHEVLQISRVQLDTLLADVRRRPLHDREMIYPSVENAQGIRVSLAAAPILDPQEQIRSYVFIAKDITRRKALEHELEATRDGALESSRLKSEFLANMSHEIRTPMNGVMGMLELMLDTDLTRSQQEMARTAMDSANVLLGILNDILDISKIEAGKLTFESIDFELQGLVDETIQLLALRAHEKDLSLTGLVLSDRPVVVRGDPGRLRQVLINLVSNAIKFTDRGEIALRVHVLESSTSDIAIRIEVEDTGIGIPEDRQRSIFGLFMQGDGSTTRTYGGTGLGLAICQQIVHLMNGEIGVRSTPGVGSTFWFSVRLPPGQLHGLDTGSMSRRLEGKSVLLVVDREADRRILEFYVDSWKMDRESVTDGEAALLALRRRARDGHPFQAVLLDKDIPGLDGTLFARFLSMDPEIPTPRVLLLATVGHLKPRDLANAGIDSQLSKPITKQRLFKDLVQLLQQDAHSGEQAKNSQSGKSSFEQARILVVEDNPVNAKVVRRQLRKLGCQVGMARNGMEAIAALERESYAMLFMDCQMPILDGYQTTRRIRNRDDSIASIPIVAMTAHALQGERDKCMAAGMDDYLSKPFTRSTLIATLEKWLAPAGESKDDEDEV